MFENHPVPECLKPGNKVCVSKSVRYGADRLTVETVVKLTPTQVVTLGPYDQQFRYYRKDGRGVGDRWAQIVPWTPEIRAELASIRSFRALDRIVQELTPARIKKLSTEKRDELTLAIRAIIGEGDAKAGSN